MPRENVALVVGADDATGGAIARRFAREGHFACLTRRHADKLNPLVQQIEAAGGEAKARDGILNPEAIAETYWLLHSQPRSAWTHELDLRPWAEKW